MRWAIIKNEMKRELIIEKYGLGNAVVVLDSGKIVDLFIDPPSNSSFYSPNTFVEVKISSSTEIKLQKSSVSKILPINSIGTIK